MNKIHQIRPIRMAAMLALVVSSTFVFSGCKDDKKTTTDTTVTTSPVPGGDGTAVPSPSAGSQTTTPPDEKGKNVNTPVTAAMGGDKQGSDPISFLLDDQVKKEVGFTDQQTTDLKKVRDEVRDTTSAKFKAMGLDKLDAEGKKAKVKESAKELEGILNDSRAKIDKIIKPEQAKRLKEIALQRYGWGPLTSELFSADLKLTDKQKADLRTIGEQMQAKNSTGWELPTGDEANKTKILNDNRKRMEAILKDVNEQSLAVLTAEQKASLDKLKGAPFAYTTPAPGTPAK
jgi:Spy/CpxP family protein refolding chaperone